MCQIIIKEKLYSLLDHLMCELDYRFDSCKAEAIFSGFVIVPAKLIAVVQQPAKGRWK